MLEVLVTLFTDTFLGTIWPWLAAGLASVLALVVAYFKGRRDKGLDQDLDQAYDYQETRERMDEVGTDDDAAAALERLRNRKPRSALRRYLEGPR